MFLKSPTCTLLALAAITGASCSLFQSRFRAPADCSGSERVEALNAKADATALRTDRSAPDTTADVLRRVEATGQSTPADDRGLEARILELVNRERSAAGKRPLSLSPELARAAREHSRAMADDSFFTHRGAGEPGLSERVAASGGASDHFGENIFETAEGGEIARECVTMWMLNPGHRRNLLEADFSRTGIAVAHSAHGTSYITEDFAH